MIDSANQKHVVMLGTDFSSPGGITAVVRSYRDAGLFDRWPVRFLPTYRRNTTIDKLRTAALALLRCCTWLLRGQVAVVHAHTAARASFWRKSLLLMLGRACGAHCILHLHDGSFPAYYDACGPLRKRLMRHILASMDRVVVLTPGWLERIRRIQPSARFEVIANPVSALRIPRQPCAREVLFLGRLWREKGAYDLIEATAILAREFPDLCIVCAGDGDLAVLRDRASTLGISHNVVFPGWVDGAEKDALLARATVFVLPSYFEGLPIGILEAMINGIPVVATRVGGIPDALMGDAGLMIEAGDVAGLAEALARVLRDSALQHALGSAGKQRAERAYACEQVFASIGALYREFGVTPVDAGDALPSKHNIEDRQKCAD